MLDDVDMRPSSATYINKKDAEHLYKIIHDSHESLNSARMRFISYYIDDDDSFMEFRKKYSKQYNKYIKSELNWNHWLVESVMSGMFDEIIMKEMD